MKKTYYRPQNVVHHVEICQVIAQSALSISNNNADDSEAEVREEVSWIDMWSETDNFANDTW